MKKAFTLVEVLVVLAAVSILSGVGYLAVTGAQTAAREAKLESDVEVLNRAVQLYLSSGGNLSQATTPGQVLAKLKSRKTDDTAKRTIGLRESFIDLRVSSNDQSPGEAATSQLRARWDSGSSSFYTARSGDRGVKEFPLLNTEEITAPDAEDRAPTLAGATTNSWVWDYSTPSAPSGSTPITPSTGTGNSTGGGNNTSTSFSSLASPIIMPPGGAFEAGQFPSSVTIMNPNPGGSSSISYSTGGGWMTYSGPIAITGNTTVVAFAASADTSRYAPSGTVSETYTLVPTPVIELVQLSTPQISPPGGTFSSSLFPMTITITNPNPAGSSIMRIVDGTTTYNAVEAQTTITITGTTTVTATAISSDSSRYTNSATASETYTSQDSISSVDGTLVGSANINGTFVGSLIWAKPPTNKKITFNSSARILKGNLYFPGTPQIEVLNNVRVVNRGAAFNAATAPNIPRTEIAGRQFTKDGIEIIPASDTRQIVDLEGPTTPNNYDVQFNNSAVVEGKIYRRAEVPSFPTVTLPTGLTSNSTNINVNGGQALSLPSGNYTSSINVGGTVKLGNSNFQPGDPPMRYVFNGINLNSGGKIEIVGPVIVTMRSKLIINGSTVMGNSTNPGWLQLEMFGSADLQMNSGSQLYARVVAPTSKVGLDGTFNGSVTTNELTINGNGIAFTDSPVIGN